VPILKNQRWEIFAQAIAKGETSTKAYITAGFRPSRKNASRLRAKEDVSARINELQLVTAKSAEISIQSICEELDRACSVARERGQANAMVSAASLRAKLAGLLKDRVEISSADPFEGASSMADIADRMLADMVERFKPIDERDRDGLIDLLQRQAEEMQGFMSAIAARPIAAERVNPARMETPWQELQRHPSALVESPATIRNRLINKPMKMSPVRLGNGRPR
jgi:hypothetical protein